MQTSRNSLIVVSFIMAFSYNITALQSSLQEFVEDQSSDVAGKKETKKHMLSTEETNEETSTKHEEKKAKKLKVILQQFFRQSELRWFDSVDS